MSLWFLPSAFTVALLCSLCAYTIVQKPPPPLRPILLLALLMPALFATGDTLTYFVNPSSPGWHMAFANAIQYTGLIFVPPTWFTLIVCFAESNNRPFSWSNSRWLQLPNIVAGLLWLGMITNPMHNQFLNIRPGHEHEATWLWLCHAFWGYLVSFAGVAACVSLALRTTIRSIRHRIYFVLMTPLFTALTSLAYVVSLSNFPFDPTPLACGLSAVLFMAGSYRTGVFALSPLTLTSIISRQPSGVITIDHEGYVATWNPAAQQIFGTSIDRIDTPLYEWLADRITESGSQRSRKLTAASLKEQLVMSATAASGVPKLFKLTTTQGTRWVCLELTKLSDWRASAVSHSLQIEDHTELYSEQTQRMALIQKISTTQKDEGLTVLAGGVAHDFNNVLMTIRGNLELIQLDSDIGASTQRRLSTIGSAVDHAARLTQQLVAYSGKPSTERVRVCLKDLIEDTAELISALFASKGARLELDLTEGLWIDADRSQLEQVVMNLAINAAESLDLDLAVLTSDASGPTSRSTQPLNFRSNSVTIRTGHVVRGKKAQKEHRDTETPATQNQCFLEVIDSGCGIELDSLEHIFDPFFTTKATGSGLGLAAVKGIVGAHNGSIEVVSDPRAGSCFRLIFPTSTKTHSRDQPYSESAFTRKSHVIVIDDEPTVLKVTSDLLARTGCNVVTAVEGKTAIDLVKASIEDFTAAVIDVRMPGMDGFTLADELRKINPNLALIMVSGHHDKIYKKETQGMTGIRLVAKPFSIEQLQIALKSAEQEMLAASRHLEREKA